MAVGEAAPGPFDGSKLIALQPPRGEPQLKDPNEQDHDIKLIPSKFPYKPQSHAGKNEKADD